MGKLSRLIGGVVAGKLTGWRHGRSPSHVAGCADCRAALRRERQYLERLRAASIPQASSDLTARLLERTYRLAQDPGAGQIGAAASAAPPTHRHGIVALGAAAGGAALAAGILAVAVYAVAGDPLPAARADGQGAVPMTFAGMAPTTAATAAPATSAPDKTDADRQGSGAVNGDLSALSKTGQTPSESHAGHGIPGTVTHGLSAELSPQQLDVLRAEGWTCPELRSLGFHLDAARATVGDAGAAVELRLSNGEYHATVVERHSAPANVQLGAGHLSLVRGIPWQATYSTPLATLSIASDLPSDRTDEAVAELVRAGTAAGTAQAEPGPESVVDRIQRGLRTIAALAGF